MDDAEAYLRALPARLAMFGLQLAEEKSALVKFNGWEGESSGKFKRFMASDKVPEGVRLSYAMSKLKEPIRGCIFKEADRTNKGAFAFEVDEKGDWVVDEEKTRIMRERLAMQIEILEQRLTEIYNPHKEAEKRMESNG